MASSVVVKDLRLKDEDKGKESSFKDNDKDLMSMDEDKDEDLKIGPRGSSRTRTFFEDNNTDGITGRLRISVLRKNRGHISCTFRMTTAVVLGEVSEQQ